MERILLHVMEGGTLTRRYCMNLFKMSYKIVMEVALTLKFCLAEIG